MNSRIYAEETTVLEAIPLKQGLKHQTKPGPDHVLAFVLEAIPLKQGLKLENITAIVRHLSSLRSDSIKTRIETLKFRYNQASWKCLRSDSIKTRIETCVSFAVR